MLIRYYSPDNGGEGAPSASDLVDQYKDATKIAEKLSKVLQENYDYREQLRQTKAELETAKKQVPADGSVILTAEQGNAWESYQQLGKPSDLQTALTERDTAKADLAKTRRDLSLNEAAGLYGYKPTVLGKLPGFEQPVSVKDGTDSEGKPIKQAFVATDAGDVALPDYIKQHYADFEPALIASQQPQPTPRQPWPPQANNGSGTPGDLVGDALKRQQEQRDARPNPLFPKQG